MEEILKQTRLSFYSLILQSVKKKKKEKISHRYYIVNKRNRLRKMNILDIKIVS